MTNLTPKQTRFCAEYLKDLNGTQAAIRAGYSERSAASQASRLLKKDKVQRAIRQAMADRAMTPEEVSYRLSMQARTSMADLISIRGNGMYFDWNKAQETGALAHVARISVDGKTGMVTEVHLYDAQKALVQLGKAHAMFTEKHEHTHSFEHELEAAGFSPGDTFEQLIRSVERTLANSET